ncbi:MAG TPA: ATP-binding cassette domain-containing protein, partial [Alphaproteobacteria bacterium]|nr:ATP-binding cassette domain-containing protein [Alphaproteobacteria bacterium]
MLSIDNLHAAVDGNEILKGLTLDINPGEVHAIMGPNGSGKSTLSYVLAGREDYEVTDGDIFYDRASIMELAPDERAALGIFLAFQYPVEIPGVATTTFLRTALNALRRARGEDEINAAAFLKKQRDVANKLGVS